VLTPPPMNIKYTIAMIVKKGRALTRKSIRDAWKRGLFLLITPIKSAKNVTPRRKR
jgi:hypothetical protein